MKTKFALLLSALALVAACSSGQSHMMLQLDVPTTGDYSLDKTGKIYLLDFIVAMSDKSYDPTEQIRKYFAEDFAAYIGKSIVPVAIAGWDKVRQDAAGAASFAFTDAANFRKLLAGYPQGLFLAGSVSGDIKTTSVIREVRDEKGEKRNAFVQQQLWDTQTKLYLIDADSGEVVLERESKDKTTVTEAISPRFQYEQILVKASDKLQADFQKRSRKQERYILFK